MARDCPRFAREEARGAPRRRGVASTPRRRRRATAAPPCPSPLAGSRGRARLARGAGRCGRAADAVSRRLGSGARATRRRRGRAPGARVGIPVGARALRVGEGASASFRATKSTREPRAVRSVESAACSATNVLPAPRGRGPRRGSEKAPAGAARPRPGARRRPQVQVLLRARARLQLGERLLLVRRQRVERRRARLELGRALAAVDLGLHAQSQVGRLGEESRPYAVGSPGSGEAGGWHVPRAQVLPNAVCGE